MAPELRLIGEKKSLRNLVKGSVILIVIATVVLVLLFVSPYIGVDTPVDTSKDFVKAVMNGDAQTIDNLNYTKLSEQTIKTKWAYILEDYEFSDLVFTQSEGMNHRVNVISNDGKVKLTIDTAVMNGHRYVKYISP